MDDDWDRRLGELERVIDGAGKDEALPVKGKKEARSRTRVVRWTAIGVGTGLGLVLAYVLLKPLVVVLLLAGLGYGGYRLYKLRSEPDEAK